MTRTDEDRVRDAGTFLALFGMLLLAGLLLGMLALVMPTILGVVTVLGAFLLLLAAQYGLSRLMLRGEPESGDPDADDEERRSDSAE